MRQDSRFFDSLGAGQYSSSVPISWDPVSQTQSGTSNNWRKWASFPGEEYFDEIHYTDILEGLSNGSTALCWRCHRAGLLKTANEYDNLGGSGNTAHLGMEHQSCDPCHASVLSDYFGTPATMKLKMFVPFHGGDYIYSGIYTGYQLKPYSFADRGSFASYEINAPREALDCTYCHQGVRSDTTPTVGPHRIRQSHETQFSDPSCSECHFADLLKEHAKAESGSLACASCHESSDPKTREAIGNRAAFYFRIYGGIRAATASSSPLPARVIPLVSEETSFTGKLITATRLTVFSRGVFASQGPTLTVEGLIDGQWQPVYTRKVPLVVDFLGSPSLAETLAFPPAQAVRVTLVGATKGAGNYFNEESKDSATQVKLDRWGFSEPDVVTCESCHQPHEDNP